jgi:peptidoglycan/xylan/chitin deacetylase (PgdA/CDA1 family)/2-polyprenyl-3-methyl-5-hydroxy-6-metoxy-1,4-benzoquinol methylase
MFIDKNFALIPPALFLAVTFAAPFMPAFSYFLPVVSRGSRSRKEACLTFDDGPDPRATPALLDLLDRHGVRAAFFVTGKKSLALPHVVREIAARGHQVGNHSFSHDPLLMLKSGAVLKREIARAQEVLAGLGILSLAFRPPVGVTSPRLWPVLLDLGMFCMNFSNRPADFGNRRLAGLSLRVLKRIRPGDVIVLHDRDPGGDKLRVWLEEVENIIVGARERGFEIIPPDRLVGRPLCRPEGAGPTAVSTFYDALAPNYDDEQLNTGVSMVRKVELGLFAHKKALLFGPGVRVLELGAGTGLFTLAMAEAGAVVTALDASSDMLKVLEAKAARLTRGSISAVQADIERYEPGEAYDVICSFSALEYVGDVQRLMAVAAACLRPGGHLYLTTARASLVRFFAQAGNALRQGMWLRARTPRSMKKVLVAAGLEPLEIASHGCAVAPLRGMVLEVLARKPSGDR